MRVGDTFCPGILHAVPAKDGLLMRIRVPGGLLSAHQLSIIAALCETFADGWIEVTSRANLQLRAIRPENLPAIVDALTSSGLLPSAQHDRVRNISTSPFAGLEAGVVIDTRSLVRTLDRRLTAEAAFAALPPKFNFGIYGGGPVYSREQDDLALHAMAGTSTFALCAGGSYTGYVVSAAGAVDCLLEAARQLLRLGREHDLPARARRLLSIPNLPSVPSVLDEVLEPLHGWLTRWPIFTPPEIMTASMTGVHPSAGGEQVNIVPSVPLGRLTARQAQQVAASAGRTQADLRLAAWRGIVLGAVRQSDAAAVVSELDGVDLSVDRSNGFEGLAACAGVTGCDAAHADVRSDAIRLGRALAGRGMLAGWTANFSGCEKQCAMRHAASAELVGGPDGYLLRIGGKTIAGAVNADYAIHLVLAAHQAGVEEAARS